MQLSDYIDINPRTQLRRDCDVPFVGMDAIQPGQRKVEAHERRRANGSGAKFSPKDTLFARITPCLENGKIGQYFGKEPGFGSTEFFVLRAKPGIADPDFVFYFALNRELRSSAEKSMSGASGRQRADVSALSDFKCNFPKLPNQQQVASILSAYDDLIENNTRRIKILEEISQLIYREWFVNFRYPGHEKVEMISTRFGKIPKGWETRNLFDVADVTYGLPFQSKGFSEERIGKPVIRIRDLIPNRSRTYTAEVCDEKYNVINRDLLVGMDGDFHMCKWAGGDAYLNQRVVRFRPKGRISRYYLFLALKKPIHFFDTTVVGTTVAHLSDQHLRSIQIAVPSNTLMDITSATLDPMFELENTLLCENLNLRTTRDLLIPKLISGELDVSELDIEVLATK